MFAFNTTDPPEQNVVDPPAVIVAAGKAFTVTELPVEVAVQTPLAVTTTV